MSEEKKTNIDNIPLKKAVLGFIGLLGVWPFYIICTVLFVIY